MVSKASVGGPEDVRTRAPVDIRVGHQDSEHRREVPGRTRNGSVVGKEQKPPAPSYPRHQGLHFRSREGRRVRVAPVLCVLGRQRVGHHEHPASLKCLNRERLGIGLHHVPVGPEQVGEGLVAPLCRVKVEMSLVDADGRPSARLERRARVVEPEGLVADLLAGQGPWLDHYGQRRDPLPKPSQRPSPSITKDSLGHRVGRFAPHPGPTTRPHSGIERP